MQSRATRHGAITDIVVQAATRAYSRFASPVILSIRYLRAQLLDLASAHAMGQHGDRGIRSFLKPRDHVQTGESPGLDPAEKSSKDNHRTYEAHENC